LKVEAEELENALEELEVRLERLRALYEQYFLGIEKLEPQIPRKDVDRRIYLLRREKIRNTGKRFKLQTLIQRYNTFQQYWQRICREIENGTYKRHIARAEKNIGPTELLTVAARRRFAKERDRRASDQPLAKSSLPPPQERASSLPPDSGNAVTRPPAARRTPTLRGISTPPPPGVEAPVSLRPPPPAPLPANQPPQAARPSARPAFESLELDMDFMGDWDPRAATTGRRVPAPPAIPREAKVPRSAAEEVAPQRRLAPPPKPGRAAQESQPEAEAPPHRGAAPEPVAARPVAPEPKPTETSAAAPRPAKAPGAQRTAPAQAQAKPEAKPEAKPARPAAANVTDERLKEVHQRFVEASKSAGQNAVSYEGLAKSLRAVEAKLRAQHGANRRVDFEVVVKDGKPVVKPIVR
jgi:hypothetical protein